MAGQVGEPLFDGIAALVMRRLRNHRPHQITGFLAQNTGGGSTLVAVDLATLGIFRREVDDGQLQGKRVGDADMSIDSAEVNRMVVAGIVDIPARGQGLDRPERLVPALANQPFAGRSDSRFGAEPFAEFLNRLDADHVDGQFLEPGAGQVHVGVVESGHDKVPAEIDNLRFRPFPFCDLVMRANR